MPVRAEKGPLCRKLTGKEGFSGQESGGEQVGAIRASRRDPELVVEPEMNDDEGEIER